MEALHAHSRAADAAVWSGAGMQRRHGRVALGGIARMSVGDQDRVDLGLGAANAASGLETADGEHLVPADQPVAGGHRLAVVEQGSVAKYHRVAGVISNHNFESTLRCPADQLADGSDIVAHPASDG